MGLLQNGNFTQALRYMYTRWFDPAIANVQFAMDNDRDMAFSDPTGTYAILALAADTDGRIRLDREAKYGARTPLQFYFNAAGGLVTQAFYVNPTNHNQVITGIEEIHATAETATGTATAVITHDTSGQAPGPALW